MIPSVLNLATTYYQEYKWASTRNTRPQYLINLINFCKYLEEMHEMNQSTIYQKIYLTHFWSKRRDTTIPPPLNDNKYRESEPPVPPPSNPPYFPLQKSLSPPSPNSPPALRPVVESCTQSCVLESSSITHSREKFYRLPNQIDISRGGYMEIARMNQPYVRVPGRPSFVARTWQCSSVKWLSFRLGRLIHEMHK